MKIQNSFSRLAGASAMLSFPLALLSLAMIFGAFNWDFETAFDPAKAIAYQPDPSQMLRMGWMLDVLGYYLLLAPAVIYLHHLRAEKAPLHCKLFTFCGLGYILAGALGAAMLAGTSVPVYQAYQGGDAVQQAAAVAVFSNLFNEVFDGIWNQFSMLLAAVWWLGMGWLLRPEHKWLGWFSTLLGIASLLDVAGVMIQSEIISSLGLNFYLWLAPVWALLLGIKFWRQKSLVKTIANEKAKALVDLTV